MKKISLLAIAAIFIVSMFTGCSAVSENHYSLVGEWLLTGIDNFYTGEEYDYTDEIFIFNEDGTGMEIYNPCDYYEELSYISWKIESDSPTTVSIKHSEEYIYEFNIVSVSDDTLQCSYYFENDPDTYYLATYQKMQEGSSDFVGCWFYSEYYEGEEYFDSDYYYIYLYPDGTMMDLYYEVQDQMSDYGTWEYDGKYLSITFDGFETTRYDTSVQNNKMSLYETAGNGTKLTHVYKRYYGLITNTPPTTYPQDMVEAINEFFSAIFKKLAGNFAK